MDIITRRILLALIPILIFGGIGGWVWYDYRTTAAPNEPKPSVEAPFEGEPYDSDPDEEAGALTAEPSQPEGQDAPAETPEKAAPAEATEAEVLAELDKMLPAPLAALLRAGDHPLRMVVQLMDALAHGERPLPLLASLQPKEAFTADNGADGRLVVSAAAIARYQIAAFLLDIFDARAMAALYRKAEPLLQRECEAIGYQDTPVRKLLTDACTTILSLPDFDFEPTLVKRAPGLYTYEDAAFEGLNDAQKLCVRLGWRNCQRLKRLTNDFASELGL